MLKCPDSEIAENLETLPALLPGAVPMISPSARHKENAMPELTPTSVWMERIEHTEDLEELAATLRDWLQELDFQA